MMSEISQMPTCSRCGAALSSDALKGLCPRCLLALNLAAPTEIPGETGPRGTKVVKVPPTPEEIAKHFPQFEILECLGRGGMGVVYKARQPKLNRIVALKVLAPEKVAETRFAGRFEREAQALARLNHPNIVTVYDFGEADGLYYLTMEFVDGVSLRQLLQTRKIAPEEALAIVPKICEALQFAHELGVVHRDIKPENVLLDKRGRVKIADFGIAKIVGGTGQPLTRPADTLSPSDGERAGARGEGTLTQDQVLGTPNYMAPEQMTKPQLVDHRADIYSLGVVFYEMLTGELPLGKFAPPSKKVQVDVRLDEVVLHALEKEPERRYQQASEVKTDVETIAGSAVASAAQVDASSTGTTRKAFGGALNAAREARALSEPRFSRTAIVGACWSVFGLLAALFSLIALVEGGPGQTPTRLGLILAVALVPLGLTSLFGTTILGLIAISQIRHSSGRLCGLSLAVFDALLFPLLALNGLLIGGWNFAADELADALIPHLGRGLFTVLMLGAMAASCGAATWFIGRAAWRAASKPLANGQLPSAATVAPPPRSGGAWKVAAVIAATVVLILAVPVGAVFLAIYLPAHSRQQQVRAEAVVRIEERLRREILLRLEEGGWKPESLSVSVSPDLKRGECRFGTVWKNGLSQIPFNAAIHLEPRSGSRLWQVRGEGEFQSLRFSVDCSAEIASRQDEPPAAVALAVSFGPVRELTLNCVDDFRGSEALDLDSGRLLDLPKDPGKLSKPEQAQWFKEQSADLLLHNANGRWGLLTTVDNELKLVPLRNDRWEVVSESSLSNALAGLPGEMKADPRRPHRVFADSRWQTVPEADLPVRPPPALEVGQRDYWRIYLLPTNAQPHLTFAFQTASGSRGLLQITGLITEKPNSGQLRYKLVRGGPAPSSIAATASAAPDPVMILRDNMALDLDAGALRETRRETNRAQLAILDVAWDNDGGGALMRNPFGKAKLLPLPDAGDFAHAVAKAVERRTLVAGSEDRGEFASKCRFFAVLTDEARLTAIEVKDFDRMQATIRWRLLDAPGTKPRADAGGFGPVIELTVSGETGYLDLDRGVSLAPPPNLAGRNAIHEWAKSSGADGTVWLHLVDDKVVDGAFDAIDMLTASASERAWDHMTPRELSDGLGAEIERSGQGTLSIMKLKTQNERGQNVVWLFQTREASFGMLQITGFTDNPRGVKIRYKLVGGEAEKPAASPGGASELTVAKDGSGTHSSVQAALDDVTEGAVIHLAAGRYDETLVINKPVTLVGAGWDKTVIGPAQPWTGPSAEAVQELERQMRAAKTDAERSRLRDEARARFFKPVVRVQGAEGVRLMGIEFTQPGISPEGKLLDATVVAVRDAQVSFADCAVVGSPGNGILIADGSSVAVSNTLVAAAWNTGIRIERGTNSHLVVTDSDIRNCHYAGIVLGRGQSNVSIQRCRISGAAWHGIRYDDASPSIADNLIFANARSGIYASGKTAAQVGRNVFWKNEMNGMSCWFENRDRIVNNTFASNSREGLAVLGASEPVIERNIFWANPQGILQGSINSKSPKAQALGKLLLRECLFWTNGVNIASSAGQPPGDTNAPAQLPLTDFAGNLEVDPGFNNAAHGDFTLLPEGAATRAGIGAPTVLQLKRPWPLQVEEKAIIPDGDTRDSRQWKRLDGP